MNPEYPEINVKKDLANSRSIYRFYQKLLAFRKNSETAIYGETREYDHNNTRIIAYSRTWQRKKLFVIGNFSTHETYYRLPELMNREELVLNNYTDLELNGLDVKLKPYQAVVFEKK